MKNLIFLMASCASLACFSDLPVGADLFKPAALDSPMSVETTNYKFSIQDLDSGTLVKGISTTGMSIEHNISEAGFSRTERLFAFESHGCNEKYIDLVVQLGPGKDSDVDVRSYYRIVFSTNLSAVVAEFYDPSVSTVNAVLPLQSVEEVPNPDTGAKISCNGSVPFVNAKASQDNKP